MEGIKRLEKMAEGQQSRVLMAIVNYLTTQIDMNEKYLNEEKNLKEMMSYIEGEILSDFCKVMNTDNPSSYAKEVKYNGKNVKCLPVEFSDEKTYKLAIKYFNCSNEELGIKKEVKIEEQIKNKENDEFGSIFGEEKNNNKEKKEEIEQISLFGM